MLVKFITKIKEEIADITSVRYSFVGPKIDESIEFTKSILDTLFERGLNRFEIHDRVFQKINKITVTLNYTNSTSNTLVFVPPSDLEWVSPLTPKPPSTPDWLKPLMRKNTNTVYQDTNFAKNTIFNILKEKANNALAASGTTKGTKNLVYYSVGGKLDFIDTLAISLKTLFEKGGNNFDVLFICPQTWVSGINDLLQPYNKTAHFLVVPDVQDGIRITLNRFKIYDFELINNYKHILYLDADIVINSELDPIFSNTVIKKLNTAYNKNITTGGHKGIFHSLRYLPSNDENLINLESNIPFNSGQFSFKNSAQMKLHFDNLRWLARVWPGEYFTDQAFMCTYFCFFGLTTPTLQNYVDLHHITDSSNFEEGKALTHFIGRCQDATAKTDAMKKYAGL